MPSSGGKDSVRRMFKKLRFCVIADNHGHDHAESHGYAPWSNQETLTKKSFDVSGAVDDPENLNTIGERAVEDEIALEALHRPGADGREARIPKAPLRAQFRHVRYNKA